MIYYEIQWKFSYRDVLMNYLNSCYYLFHIWSHFHFFPANYSPRNSNSKSFQFSFRDKGTILKHIIVPYHAHILNLVVHLWAKGLFLRERLRKGCDSSIIITPRVSEGCNSFDIVCLSVSLCPSHSPSWTGWGRDLKFNIQVWHDNI